MPEFVADENFNNDIIRGLRQRLPSIDIVRVQDVGLYGLSDHDVLEWAAEVNRILLTHDVETIPQVAYKRVRSGKPMSGVVMVPQRLSVGTAIRDLMLISEYSLDNEWNRQIIYLPLT